MSDRTTIFTTSCIKHLFWVLGIVLGSGATAEPDKIPEGGLPRATSTWRFFCFSSESSSALSPTESSLPRAHSARLESSYPGERRPSFPGGLSLLLSLWHQLWGYTEA